jgi:DNA-binding SARP family transcriptional activator
VTGEEPPPGSALRIRLFGPLEVEGIGTDRLGSRKQRTLLRLLASSAGVPVPVDRIVDCLWPDAVPASPGTQVSVLVSRLRAALGGDRVTRLDSGYALHADWVDLAAVQELATEAEHRLAAGQPALAGTAVDAALALERGPLLGDESDAAWVEEVRSPVRRLLTRLRVLGAQACLSCGDPFGAVVRASAALDRDPFDENAVHLLMTAQARAGQPASALVTYAETRRLLADELGTDPSLAVQELHAAILRAEVAPDAPGTDRVPASAPPGRSGPWHDLDAAYRAARHGVVTVVVEGVAGIGKTSLVRAWTQAAAEDGGTVLLGQCDTVGAALPLQAPLDAVHARLARTSPAERDELAAVAGPLLAPMLGLHPRGAPSTAAGVDPLTAQPVLFAALLASCAWFGADAHPAVLVVEDAQEADTATLAWLGWAARRAPDARLLVIAVRRTVGTRTDQLGDDPSPTLPAATRIALGPLSVEDAATVVGPERAADLHRRSGGHPLYLVELARAPDGELPDSVVAAVGARVERTGAAAATLRSAAVLGGGIDLELLAGVLARPEVEVLADLEAGAEHGILEERGAAFAFRHELVREALEATCGEPRRVLVHREAARLLIARPFHDPARVAHHARGGGDPQLASRALTEAAATASARFDHAEAEHLLDDAVSLDPAAQTFLARGRVRLTREDFAGAAQDAQAALSTGGGVPALELAGWSAYYRRDFVTARAFAAQAEELAEQHAGPGAVPAGVLTLAGRIDHAAGDLRAAGDRLQRAVDQPAGPWSPVACIWLSWLQLDRGEIERAHDLLTRAARDGSVGIHPFAAAHRMLQLAVSAGLGGRTEDALRLLDQVDGEVERRQLVHFAGRTANYRAWLLRNLLSLPAAQELNEAAAEQADRGAQREPRVQAALDLCDGHLRAGDLDRAASGLLGVDALTTRSYAFAWRGALRRRLLGARVALAQGSAEEAAARAAEVAVEARDLGVRRYVVLAGLLHAESDPAATAPADVQAMLGELGRIAAPESWWVTAQVARSYAVDAWWRLAWEQAAQLAAGAGSYREAFERQAATMLDSMSTDRRSG